MFELCSLISFVTQLLVKCCIFTLAPKTNKKCNPKGRMFQMTANEGHLTESSYITWCMIPGFQADWVVRSTNNECIHSFPSSALRSCWNTVSMKVVRQDTQVIWLIYLFTYIGLKQLLISFLPFTQDCKNREAMETCVQTLLSFVSHSIS